MQKKICIYLNNFWNTFCTTERVYNRIPSFLDSCHLRDVSSCVADLSRNFLNFAEPRNRSGRCFFAIDSSRALAIR